MLVVGLTGGLGAGKTTVANLFAKLGAPVIDADMIAREVTEPNTAAYFDIIDHFDEEVLLENGALDRAKIRNIVFNDIDERRWLESLLHPLILEKIAKDITKLKAPYCIVVIPLLVETGPYAFIDRVLVVDSPVNTQIDRAVTRDHIKVQHAQAILNSQLSREQRLAVADDIILNDGDINKLPPQVEKLHAFYS
jgi:dephospho-CoA kinase